MVLLGGPVDDGLPPLWRYIQQPDKPTQLSADPCCEQPMPIHRAVCKHSQSVAGNPSTLTVAELAALKKCKKTDNHGNDLNHKVK